MVQISGDIYRVDFKVFGGGTYGSLLYTGITLYDANDTYLVCSRLGAPIEAMHYESLIPGAWYFITIFNADSNPGTFTLKIKNQVDNDVKAKAEILPHTVSWRSVNAVYSNIGATGDGPSNSCSLYWYQNVWFKFQATTKEVDIKILSDGEIGTMTYISLTLYDANNSQLSCDRDGGSTGAIQYATLTPGAWYFLSVFNAAALPGTFAIQVKNAIDFDYKVGAVELEHTQQWCSNDAAYDNLNSTKDIIPNVTTTQYFKNVWFRFQATSSTVKIKVLSGAEKGSFTNPVIFLTDNTGSALVTSTTGLLEFTTLQKGNKYMISVGHSAGNGGTFTLCLEGRAAASQLCQSVYCDGEGNVSIGTPLSATGYRLSVQGK
jgi:hypothetical protein